MASPDIASFITLEWCLICISPYFMLSFLMFFSLNFEAKSIDFVFILTKVDT